MMNYEILYEDLKNQYPELYRDLQELDSLIKTKYEAYLRTFQRFCKTIEEAEGLHEKVVREFAEAQVILGNPKFGVVVGELAESELEKYDWNWRKNG
jgi:hypothetical protein